MDHQELGGIAGARIHLTGIWAHGGTNVGDGHIPAGRKAHRGQICPLLSIGTKLQLPAPNYQSMSARFSFRRIGIVSRLANDQGICRDKEFWVHAYVHVCHFKGLFGVSFTRHGVGGNDFGKVGLEFPCQDISPGLRPRYSKHC